MPFTQTSSQRAFGSLSERLDGSVACLGLRRVQIAAQDDGYVIGQPTEARMHRLKREQLRLIRILDVRGVQADDAQPLWPLGHLDLDHQGPVRPWQAGRLLNMCEREPRCDQDAEVVPARPPRRQHAGDHRVAHSVQAGRPACKRLWGDLLQTHNIGAIEEDTIGLCVEKFGALIDVPGEHTA